MTLCSRWAFAALAIAGLATRPAGMAAQLAVDRVQPANVPKAADGMPVLMPFMDAKHWVLMNPLRYTIANSADVVIVPAGFVTDYASVPRPLWSLLAPTGKYLVAAIVHDYLYWEQVCSRGEADRLFLLLMRQSGVSLPERWAMYLAVERFGGSAWAENQRQRKRKQPRVIPARWMTIPDKQTWLDYQRFLHGQRVYPAQQMQPRARFCDRGR